MMKQLLCTTFLTLGVMGAAFAEGQENWEIKLQEFKDEIQQESDAGLIVEVGLQGTAMVSFCSAGTVITTASFLIDTLPVMNPLSELLANILDENYQSIDANTFLEGSGQFGHGLVGGGPLLTLESIEYLLLFLAGKEDQSFEASKEVYESSFIVFEALLLSKESRCMMSFSKLVATLVEYEKRGLLTEEEAEAAAAMRELVNDDLEVQGGVIP